MPAVRFGSSTQAKFSDAVYVLHCVHKKTPKTSKVNIDLVQ
jgi:phage-related protein